MPAPAFRQHSGRVISLGRLLLAALFLLAIWLDASQPAQAATETYALLAAYVLAALAIAAATWNNWWLDARLAAPVHFLDVGIFTLLVFSTEGYTSPFFLFFVFLLLSAAIRWSWRETAMTAATLVVLYLLAGLLVATLGTGDFELQRFIIRSGHLLILSAILIWFGVHQGFAIPRGRADRFDLASPDDPPLETALLAAMESVQASKGSLLWRDSATGAFFELRFRTNEMKILSGSAPAIQRDSAQGPFLYDIRKNRAAGRSASRQIRLGRARDWIDPDRAQAIGLDEGVAVPLRADTGEGELFLEHVDRLSLDHIDAGEALARALGDHLRRHALLRAVEESGEARARLSLARDLHDSVVQFLAGAAFRIEAMMRQAKSGGAVEPELQELKRLMLQEQDDLRSFISAVRSGSEIDLAQLADELQSLAGKLARQWNIDCPFTAEVAPLLIPMRLSLDAQQLVREAVANAVRHGRATCVRIALAVQDDRVRLEFQDNGSGFPGAVPLSKGAEDLHPRSLNERVQEAGGELVLARLEHGTSVAITLPIRGRQ